MAAPRTEDGHKYTMKISRLTIDKLGIQMYDRVSAVIAELIANSYDADATDVTITLPFGKYLARRADDGTAVDLGYELVIQDNGMGMLSSEVNDYYLKVGTNRRADRGDKTAGGRPVLGRKGIGKLSPFGICREIRVITAGGDPDYSGKYNLSDLLLRYEDMISDEDDDYHPDPGPSDGSTRDYPGTNVILRGFDRRRVPSREVLHRQISARFGISRADWRVRVVDADSPDEHFEVGDLDLQLMEGTKINVDDRPVSVKRQSDDGKERVTEILSVTGWVAYSKDPYRDEAMAGIRVFARGKIVAQTRDFDIEAGFTGEYKMRSYVVGEIHADWLDDEDDLIRSDRQGIIWTSERGDALQQWGVTLLKELAGSSETSVRNRVWGEFLERSRLHERLTKALPHDADLRDSVERAARALVRRVDREQVRKNDEFVDRVVRLAFAVGPHQTLLRTLDQVAAVTTDTLEPVIELFERARVVEMYSLGQVAQERVDAVKTLERLLRSSSTVERDLQKLIEDAPWILYPEWTPLTRNERLSSLRTAFQTWYHRTFDTEVVTSSIESPTRQPDFVMLNYEGCVEVVEIKRPGHGLTDQEYGRAYNYLQAIGRFLRESPQLGEAFPKTRLTIVCDRLNLNDQIYAGSIETEENVRRKSWTEVLDGTRQAHEDFLSRVRELQGELPDLHELDAEEMDGRS